jgi:hypothetical protein
MKEALELLGNPNVHDFVKKPSVSATDPIEAHSQWVAARKTLDAQIEAFREDIRRRFDEIKAQCESRGTKKGRGKKATIILTPEDEKVLEDVLDVARNLVGHGNPYPERWTNPPVTEDDVEWFEDYRQITREGRMEAALRAMPTPETEEMMKVYTVYTRDYNTQGWGANQYAEARAREVAEQFELAGFKAEVKPVLNDKGAVFMREVFANTTPDQRELVLDKPCDMVEWVRLCWKRGVNPRVYNPWLPHGFEAEHGLDFFGNRK